MPRRISGDRGDGIFVARGIGRGIVQIPDPAVHAGLGGQRAKGTQPIKRNELFLEIRFRDRGLIVAGKFANQLAASIEDFESDGMRSGVRQIVVNDCAVGWVLSSGFVGRKRRVRVGICLLYTSRCV